MRDAANPWVFTDLGLDPWEGVRMVLFNASPHATHGVDVTGFLETGIESLRCHARYLEHVGTDADAMLRGFAEEAGRRLGVTHAVPFEVVRP